MQQFSIPAAPPFGRADAILFPILCCSGRVSVRLHECEHVLRANWRSSYFQEDIYTKAGWMCRKHKTKFCHPTPRSSPVVSLTKMSSFHFTFTLAGWPRREGGGTSSSAVCSKQWVMLFEYDGGGRCRARRWLEQIALAPAIFIN